MWILKNKLGGYQNTPFIIKIRIQKVHSINFVSLQFVVRDLVTRSYIFSHPNLGKVEDVVSTRIISII